MDSSKKVLADKTVIMGPMKCPKCGKTAARKEEYRLSVWYIHPVVPSAIPGVPQMTQCTIKKENA